MLRSVTLSRCIWGETAHVRAQHNSVSVVALAGQQWYLHGTLSCTTDGDL